jgi:acetoin utilization deacetylase AcuC-like enzyme
MTTLLITHPSSFNHLNPPGHPERPDRLRAVEAVLEEPRFQALHRVEAPSVPLETIALCHPMEYVEAVRAVGGAVHAVDEVVTGKATNVFCSMRPPGHHTETARPMGFCIFNQAAIAARHAQRKHGLDRVAIVDFDVHHGNGTQEIFWSDPTVMYCSTHEMPLYPGTGAVSESGDHDNIVNAPLRAGDAGSRFKEAVESRILPRLRNFGADLIIISAGFDAHRRDPLANLQLVDADFAWATQKLMEVADKTAQGRVVSVLEGGYDLEGLAQSAAAHVNALMRG